MSIAGLRSLVGIALALAVEIASGPAVSQDVARGAYLAQAGGCRGCHTEARADAVAYSGGRALSSPFGTFFGPNITPDPERGIGRWSEADFRRAMRNGVRPDGADYYPAFPYTAFTRISDQDLRDLWAFLRSLPPSDRPNTPHLLSFPFDQRWGLFAWKWAYFSPGAMPDGAEGPLSRRGAYLVEALGHCGECHTPRDRFGGLRRDMAFAGARMASGRVPNITPSKLGGWNDRDLDEFLTSGMTPDGDFAGGEMAEVIRHSTGTLTPSDRAAMIAYLRSLPPRAGAAE
jgi:mono/diheme cytochrome c family protein